MERQPIVIVGAGIGGLTAALALMRHGHAVEVYERADHLREVGAGLHLTPNGARVMQWLGLGEQLERATGRSPGQRLMRLWSTGQAWPLPGHGSDAVERFGAPYLLMHRGDLHDLLVDAVRGLDADAIRVGSECVEVRQEAGAAEAVFADGEVARGRAVICADGIGSRSRHQLFGPANPRFTGYIYWRGLIPMDLVPDSSRNQSAGWVGPDNFITVYPVRGNSLLNFNGTARREKWSSESWTEEGSREEMIADFAGWHPDIQAMIENIDRPLRWGSFLRDPLSTWVDGAVALLGDACHPMHSSLGQGANSAIEDAAVLARCFAEFEDTADALKFYQSTRVPRATQIVEASNQTRADRLSPLLADPTTAVAEMQRQWSPDRVAKNYDWIFSYDATTVPLR